jgi:transketolase N-terminal domain/subunit
VNNIIVTLKKFINFVEVNKQYQNGWVTENATLAEYKAHLAAPGWSDQGMSIRCEGRKVWQLMMRPISKQSTKMPGVTTNIVGAGRTISNS